MRSASPFIKTKNGYDPFDLFSALQKSIRRCDEEGALWWAVELWNSNLAAHAWSRLRVIAVEDVGLANPDAIGQVYNLREIWKSRKNDPDARLYYVMAVLLLVRSPKSRLVDNALIANFDSTNGKRKIVREHHPIPELDEVERITAEQFKLEDRKYREVPDEFLDKHTKRGRALGRGNEHFFDVGAKLVNAVDDDPLGWAERARAAACTAERVKAEAEIAEALAKEVEVV
jgi:hypothetical protein